MSETVETFRVDVDDSVLQDLHDRLGRTRFPDQIVGTGWEYGIPIDYLRELVEYWRDAYDWRSQEARLNELAHFRTAIDGQLIHFIHARSPHADAMPLLLTHGWPGSVVEFLDVIPRLTDPEAYGGRAADAFHVIAPSLPGYGFSEPPRTPGLGCQAHRPGVRRPDEPAGICALCGPGRRLGRPGHHPDRRPRPRALRRHPPQHAHRNAVARRSRSHRRGRGRPGCHATLSTRRSRLCQRAGDQAPDRGCLAQRLARRARWPGSWRSSGPGATATVTPRIATRETS